MLAVSFLCPAMGQGAAGDYPVPLDAEHFPDEVFR